MISQLFGHFIDNNGALCDAELEDRLTGMSPLAHRRYLSPDDPYDSVKTKPELLAALN